MHFLWISLLAVSLGTSAFATIDLVKAEKELTTAGLHGLMHAAAHEFDQYVFQIRDPESFFLSQEFSVVSTDPNVKETLKSLHRHDEVIVFGKFLSNPSPQKHIQLTAIKVVKKYNPTNSPSWPRGLTIAAHERQARLPDDLLEKKELLGVVHAAPAQGGVIVLEYKDAIVPLFFQDSTFTKNLIRGDKVRVRYTVLQYPKKPTHLMLDTQAAQPVEVIGSLAAMDGKKITLEGSLVYFPKSPQISIEVFALQHIDPDGLKRNYNLMTQDPEVFGPLYKKLTKLWGANWATALDGRNLYVNPKIRLRVTGVINVAANPQLSPATVGDVEEIP